MHEKNDISHFKRKSRRNPRLIIFTDLDGTLLDSTYSFKKALPALELIKEKNVPLVICSSKTRSEIEHCRKKLHNNHPFISENGGGIFIPRKNFKFQIANCKFEVEEGKTHYLLKLGADYIDLRRVMEELRVEGFDVEGFGDMSVKEVSELTGLGMSDAEMAKQRDFDEPFIFNGNESSVGKMQRCIKAKGYNYTRGEFHHIMGDSDKGRAVEILKGLYEKQYGKIITAALGDSLNDIEMLGGVDCPIVVKKSNGKYNSHIMKKIKGCIKADGVGPDGWNKAVIKLLG